MKAIKFYALILMLIGGQAFAGGFYSANLDHKAKRMQQNANMLMHSINHTYRFNYVRHDIKNLIHDTRKFRRALRRGYSRYTLISKFRQIKSDFYRIQRKMHHVNRYGYNHHNRRSRVKRSFKRLSRSFYKFKRTANRVVFNRYNRKRSYSYSY